MVLHRLPRMAVDPIATNGRVGHLEEPRGLGEQVLGDEIDPFPQDAAGIDGVFAAKVDAHATAERTGRHV